MANFSDIRAKYPQYNDMSDEQFATAFHNKYYSDIPYDEFKGKIGFMTQEQPTTPVEAPVTPEAPVQEQQPSTWERLFGETGKGVAQALSATKELLKDSPVSQLQAAQTGYTKGLITDPIVGAAQMVGVPIDKQAYEAFMGESNKAAEFVGSMASPINKIFGTLKAATPVKSIVQGMGAGALQSVLQPTDKEDFWKDKALQAGVGAVLGGAFPIVGLTSKSLYKIFSNVSLTEKGRVEELRKLLKEASGSERQAIIKDLRNAQQYVEGSELTVGQILADRPSAVNLVAEQVQLSGRPSVSGVFKGREAAQRQAQDTALGRIASPEGMTASQMETMRDQVTKDIRDEALAKANVYQKQGVPLEDELARLERSRVQALQGQGITSTESAQAINRAHSWSPVPGYPRFPGRYSPNMDRAIEFKSAADDFKSIVDAKRIDIDFKNAQLQNLNEQGYFPLMSNDIGKGISETLSKPGNRADQALNAVYTDTLSRIQQLTNARGLIDSNDLYKIRKDLGEDVVSSLSARNIQASDKRVAGLTKELQGLIDQSIVKAGAGDLWGKYLSKFAEYSNRADRMKIGVALQEKLGGVYDVQNLGAFGSAVSNARNLISQATGNRFKTDLGQVLTKEEMGVVNNVLADLSSKKKMQDLAKGVRATGLEGGDEFTLTVFNQKVTLVKDLLRSIRLGKQSEVDKKAAELFNDPEKMADFLEFVPKSKFDKLVPAMVKQMSPEMANAFVNRFGVGLAGIDE